MSSLNLVCKTDMIGTKTLLMSIKFFRSTSTELCVCYCICVVFLYLTSMIKIVNNTNKDRLTPH